MWRNLGYKIPKIHKMISNFWFDNKLGENVLENNLLFNFLLFKKWLLFSINMNLRILHPKF